MSKCHKIDYDFSKEESMPCRIAKGWEDAGKTGQYFGNITVNDMCWAIVLWDGEEDPDMNKIAGIEISKPNWIKAEHLE